MRTVAVVDYGMGNLRSVSQAVAHVAREADDFRVIVTGNPEEVFAAERVVLPGQGAMPDCMRELRDSGLEAAVLDAAANKPLMGVCIGMQMLLERSEEGAGAGHARARPDRRRGRPLSPRGQEPARRQPLQGAADGLERGDPGAAAPDLGGRARFQPLLFRAQLPRPAVRPAPQRRAKQITAAALPRRWRAIIFSRRSSIPRKAPHSAWPCTATS